MLNTQVDPKPDLAAIRADLEYMTARWGELPEPALFEVRAFKEGSQPQTFKYSVSWIDDAVQCIADMNQRGYNLYAVRNPIRETYAGSAKDTDIIAAFFLWADCDDPAAAGNVLRFDGPKWSAAVTTGTTPSTRAHVYWGLEEPCYDLAKWRDMQSAIAAHFGSDASVINPSRIMRIGGTVSWPFAKKREKGYISELTTLRTEYADPRPAVTLEQMGRVFAASAPAAPLLQQTTSAPGALFQIDTGDLSRKTDAEYADILRRARTDGEKHTGVRDLAASLAGSGVPRHLAEAIVREACPVWDEGVEKLIETAYAKFYRPKESQYANPAALQTSQAAPETGFDAPKRPLDLEWFDDVEPVLGGAYLVKGLLDVAVMAVVYGPSNSGKTFWTIDLAYHIAIGAPWRGRRVIQASVLYLAAEGGRGVINRVAALKQAHGVLDVPLAVKRAGLDLLHDQADLQHIVDLSAEVKAKLPDAPHLIVIDTLSRVMAGGDENSAADMTALIRNIDAIRAATNATTLLVHHTGKDAARGARGHSSLRAATDTEIEIANEDGARAAVVTKQRDHNGGETFAFDLESVTLGTDQDGDDVTSCIVKVADEEEYKAAVTQRKGLGGNQKILAETFDQMLGEGMGRPNPVGVGFPDPGRFWCVGMEEFRTAAMGKMAATNKRGAFLDAWRALTEGRGLFCAASDLVWRTDRKVN